MLGECFDPRGELAIYEHCRPHWSHAGAVVFITFRTHDSIPAEVVRRWDREKQEWLLARGVETRRTWRDVLPTLSERDRLDFHKRFNRVQEAYLDTCQGQCYLRQPALSGIVHDALLHFDGERYRMGDFVIMPNHVHLLAVFPTAQTMKQQCDSWLHYTAFRINQAIGRKGKFWQQEPFDHLVRSPEQYEYLRQYIADNPNKARLSLGAFRYRRYGG
jgi:type I restriction enzyme R subunit